MPTDFMKMDFVRIVRRLIAEMDEVKKKGVQDE